MFNSFVVLFLRALKAVRVICHEIGQTPVRTRLDGAKSLKLQRIVKRGERL